MNKNIPDYISALSENDFEILEEIFLDKYSKFIDLFFLIKEYSENITSLIYKKTKKDILKIEFTINKLNSNDVVKEIISNVKSDSGDVLVTTEKDIIKIKITKDECMSK